MMKLPDSPVSLDPSWCCCLHGFGYKIVTISYYVRCDCPEEYSDSDSDSDGAFIDIYSLKSNSWRRKGISPNASGVLLKGALHWLVSDSSSTFISAFNLASENFEREILGPNSLDTTTLMSCKLVVISACLGLIDDLSEDVVHLCRSKVNMFILKIYGSPDSWTKVVVNLESASWKKAVCIWNDWMFLSVGTDQEDGHDHDLVGYSFNDGVWAYQNIDGVEKGAHCDENGQFDCCDDKIKKEQYFDGVMFSESILSPHVFRVGGDENGQCGDCSDDENGQCDDCCDDETGQCDDCCDYETGMIDV